MMPLWMLSVSNKCENQIQSLALLPWLLSRSDLAFCAKAFYRKKNILNLHCAQGKIKGNSSLQSKAIATV